MENKCQQISDVKFDLGESLIWDSESNRLLMTDIMNGKLIELDLDSNSERQWQFDEPLAWVLPTALEKKYLLGLKSGIALFDPARPEMIRWVNRDFPIGSECRLNDASVDSAGRVWFGSMNMIDHSARDGCLASFAATDGVIIHDDGFAVTNGPVISPDGRSLFFSDTLQGTLYRYRLEIDSGKLSDRQVFAQFRAEQGFPDGMCFDIDGNLWIALWGGASVVQLDPAGKLLKQIPIPALNVTNLCFCGPNLDRLLVSTAAIGLSQEQLRRYPSSGALFELSGHLSAGFVSYPVILSPSWI
jgi:D-xylonolactonase